MPDVLVGTRPRKEASEMTEFKRRVFNPRGDRGDGGGINATIVLTEDVVQRWLGPVGQPGAVERVNVMRALDREWMGLRREIEAELVRREQERNARVVGERAEAEMDRASTTESSSVSVA